MYSRTYRCDYLIIQNINVQNEIGKHIDIIHDRQLQCVMDGLLLDEARAKYLEIAGFQAANELNNAHEHQNRGLGVTKAQYIEATMDYMENAGIFVTRYDKWFDTAVNVLQDDGSKIVSCSNKHVRLLEEPANG